MTQKEILEYRLARAIDDLATTAARRHFCGCVRGDAIHLAELDMEIDVLARQLRNLPKGS